MDKVLARSKAHPKAQELIPDGFFWSCVDEYAPFGSDEGYTALVEWRKWRKENPTKPIMSCLKWVIESVSGMSFDEYMYLMALAKDSHILKTTNISIIATGFGQFVDEGTIDPDAKIVVSMALNSEQKDAPYPYSNYIKKLLEIIKNLQ